MLNKIVKMVIICMLSFSVASCSDQLERHRNYQYIEIPECTIPISKQYHLVEHKNHEYEFSYIDKNYLVDNMHLLGIRELQQDDYPKAIKRIQDAGFKVVREYSRNNFKIIKFEMDGTRRKIINFYLLGKNSLITILNSSEENINKLLSYCIESRQ